MGRQRGRGYKRPADFLLRRLRYVDCANISLTRREVIFGLSVRMVGIGALEHALGDLALAQHHQVGAQPLEMLDRGVGMGARQDLERGD